MESLKYKKTVVKYSIGFIISLLLTFTSYFLAVTFGLKGAEIMVAIGVLALSQLIVQLIFFLHLSDEKGPRWKTWSFVAMAITLTIVVAGSIWIMYHLNYNMMSFSPDQKDSYMLEESGGGF